MTPDFDRSEKVKAILSDEISYWQKRKAEAVGDEVVKIRGAIEFLMMKSGKPETITAEALREEFKLQKVRAGTAEFKDREFDLIARNRAVKICEAVIRLGKIIVSLDGK